MNEVCLVYPHHHDLVFQQKTPLESVASAFFAICVIAAIAFLPTFYLTALARYHPYHDRRVAYPPILRLLHGHEDAGRATHRL